LCMCVGVTRARCAGHRDELKNILGDCIMISGEYQPNDREDLTYDALAGKLTRVQGQR